MTSTIITNKVNVKISTGGQVFSEFISLEKGTCVGVHLVSFQDPKPDFAIDFSVKDAQSNIILNPADYRDFQHKGGGYLQGTKQTHFRTDNNKFNIVATAENALPSDFSGQLIFIIQKDCSQGESHSF